MINAYTQALKLYALMKLLIQTRPKLHKQTAVVKIKFLRNGKVLAYATFIYNHSNYHCSVAKSKQSNLKKRIHQINTMNNSPS